MGIPESQLETWSHQGATAPASVIYKSIRTALQNDAALAMRSFELFLQGSYRNSTNIYGDSDVDVVVKLEETYMPEYGRLDAYTRNAVEGRSQSATYQFTDFRRDVSNAIRRAFPNHSITDGGKSIKIPRTANNIPADVVPCLEYRLYLPPTGLLLEPGYIEGIWLRDKQRGGEAVSFPKRHYENGGCKHTSTTQWYKPTVRVFKNARGWLEGHRVIAPGTASSHAIECLLFNVPNQCFGSSYRATFINVVNWLSEADMTSFVCQNGIQWLFEQDQWTIQKANTFIGALVQMWEQWREDARVRL